MGLINRINPQDMNGSQRLLANEISKGNAVLFYVVESEIELPAPELYLNQVEFAALATFESPERFRQYLISRWLYKTLLGSLLGIGAKELRTHAGELGKLYIDPAQNLQKIDFNISHSGEITMLGVAQGLQIGVDIERCGERKNLKEIASRFFQPPEIQWMLDAVTPEEQQTRFFRIWSMKEAVLKATGAGVFRNSHQIVFKIEDARITLDSAHEPWSQTLQWELREFDEIHGYRASMALFKG